MNTKQQADLATNTAIPAALDHTNLAELINHAVQSNPTSTAYSCLGQAYSFAYIEEKSRALANYLLNDVKLAAGDRVMVQLPNIVQYPIAAFAVLRAGLVLVNTNPLYTPREVEHQLTDSGTNAMITLTELLPVVTPIIEKKPIKQVIHTSATDLLPTTQQNTGKTIAAAQPLMQILADESLDKPLPALSSSHNDIALIQYTGGTTGVSKGAVLTHNNLLSNLWQTSERLAHVTQPNSETFITPLPLYHVYAFLLNLWVFTKGNHNVLIPDPRDLDGFINTLKEVQFTGFCGINTLFLGLSNHPRISEVNFAALKLTISGGSALTTAVAQKWHAISQSTITEGYGLSETSPVVCLNIAGQEKVGSIGPALPATEIKIVNQQGDALPLGEAGELVVKGPQVMQGYWQQPEETSKVLSADGWFKTGDIAIATADGHYKIVDRKKDMIIVSGFNVYPNEVEDVLQNHASVLESAVIGEPCAHSGERVVAYIVANNTANEIEIINYCRSMLTAYKVPKKIVFIDELPKSSVGKVLRKVLRA